MMLCPICAIDLPEGREICIHHLYEDDLPTTPPRGPLEPHEEAFAMYADGQRT